MREKSKENFVSNREGKTTPKNKNKSKKENDQSGAPKIILLLSCDEI